ncbi:MAG TPA: diacylglycerol kinase family protein [Terriglobales bacterium]|jgi:diacylglycerol kinase (ATP)
MRAAVIFGLGTSPADLKPFQTGPPTQWLQGLPASSSDADAILIFGGDGTIHRHLPALVRLQLPVLIVPAGSGNDFARALNLRSMRDSWRVWRDFESGKTRAQAVDLGVIVPSASPERTHYFCCVAGCGLDSAATRRANQMPRWLRGHGGYVLALLPALLQFPAFSMRLTQFNGTQVSDTQVSGTQFNDNDRAEGERLTLLAAFANTQFYGDGMRIAPQADLADGKLDICRINKLSPLKLLSMFPTVYFGRHLLLPEVEYSRAERVRVQTETPIEIYADGEFVCETPAEISVAAGALRVIHWPR